MSLSRIRGFLLQLPKPARIRISAGDGEPQEIRPGRSYAKTAESIVALGVDLVECIDKDGNLLRALRLSDSESHRSDAADIPDGIKADPHALMLTHFANLLHRAYEHSTEIAFTRLVELADRHMQHSESAQQQLAHAEAALRRERMERLDDAEERTLEALEKRAAEGEGGDLMQQMTAAFLQSKMGAQSTPPGKPNGKSNGKA